MLEMQRVSIHTFVGQMNDGEARVTFDISSEEDKAQRTEALLYRLEGVKLLKHDSHDSSVTIKRHMRALVERGR
jgi:hypothetical protein